MESEKKVSLTEEHLRDVAVSYVSMRDKEEFIRDASTGCFDKMEIGTENGDPLPPFYKESALRKHRYMTAALMKLYLRIECDTEAGGDPWSITDESYETAARSFLISQLERIKKRTADKELQDKIYDLLADYRLLEKLLNAECYGMLPAMNDTVSRFQMMMSAQATPEAMEALLKATEEARKELDEYNAARAGNAENRGTTK